MKMMHLTRRGFLRAACVVAGGAMISLRMAGVAVARFRDIRDYMLDRIHGVYGADAAFPVRASQETVPGSGGPLSADGRTTPRSGNCMPPI